MPFTKEIPEWNAAGAEPPQSLKDSGWSPDDRPPAEYWNWQMNLTYLALQELQQLAETKGHASKHASGGSDPILPSDIGAESAFVKNTAFNKNFGTSAGTVSEGNHSHTPSDVGAEPAFTKNTGFNKKFGTTGGTVAEGNYTKQIKDDLAMHQVNYVPHIPFAVASGSANSYTVTLNPAPTSYVNGMAVSVAINVDSTGTSTLNVNSLGAIPIKKANGNDATNLKQNGVYTFRFYDNGTNASFILQGEGGEGTAQPGEVLNGETFTNDDGVYTGTMTNQGTYNITPGTTNQAIPQGYHDGQGIVAGDSDLVAANIRNGTSVFGVAGKNTVVDTEEGSNVINPEDVLNGQVGYINGSRVVGTMTNRGGVADQASTQRAKGFEGFIVLSPNVNAYQTTNSSFRLDEAAFVSSNIRAGVTLFGLSGDSSVVDTSDATAVSSDVLDGRTFYEGGNKRTGTINDYSGQLNSTTWVNSNGDYYVDANIPFDGFYNTNSAIQISDTQLKPGNIKSGMNIFGVNGTLKEYRVKSGTFNYNDTNKHNLYIGFRPMFVALRYVVSGYDAFVVVGQHADNGTEIQIDGAINGQVAYVDMNYGSTSVGITMTSSYQGKTIEYFAIEGEWV